MDYKTVDGLIEIVKTSIEKGARFESKITPEVAQLRGMSSAKIRHTLNNLLSFGPCRYLEIGTWAGSTLIPSMFGNDVEAMAIDNFSQFGPDQEVDGFDAKKVLYANIAKFLPDRKYNSLKVCECNCFQLMPEEMIKANVFMYDGNHDEPSTRKAIVDFGKKCAKPFILVVDDLELATSVREGIDNAMKFFKVHQSWELKKNEDYHEGLFIAVLEAL